MPWFSFPLPSVPYGACLRFQNPARHIHPASQLLAGAQEFMAHLERLGDVDPIHVFAAALPEGDLVCNFHAEVVKDHARPQLLDHELAMAGTKLFRPQRVLQVAEGCLDPPTEAVKILQFEEGELGRGQVRCQVFVGILPDLDAGDADGDGDFPRLSRLQEVELGGRADEAAGILFLRMQVLGFALMAHKAPRHCDVRRCIEPPEQLLPENALRLLLGDADEVAHAGLSRMQVEVVGSESAIGGEDALGGPVQPLRQLADGLVLVFEAGRLDDCVGVLAGKQVVKGDEMHCIIPARPGDACIPVPAGMEGQFRSVAGKKLEAAEEARLELRVEALEQRGHGLLGKLGALLDECGAGRRVPGHGAAAGIEAAQFLRDAALGRGNQEEEQLTERQLPAPGEMDAGRFRELRGCHCVNGIHQAGSCGLSDVVHHGPPCNMSGKRKHPLNYKGAFSIENAPHEISCLSRPLKQKK